MKPRHVIAAAVGVVLLAGLGTRVLHRVPAEPATQNQATLPQPTLAVPDRLPGALMARPEVQRYQERIAFQNHARRFFGEAASLPAATRNRQAQSLQLQVDRYERESNLSAGEAIALRIGLIRAIETDAERQAELLADVVARYRLDAERRNLAFREAQRRDPAFNAYKADEARIVAEVMAMKQIPGGLSRNEYLRQRLQQAREIAYRVR